MAITIKLVTPTGTEIDITKNTADYRRLIEKLMIGGLPDMRVSSAGYAQKAGDYLYDITPAGRVIDLPITVLGKTEEQAMTALAELYAGSSFTPSQPMVIRVSNGTRTADLTCYIVGDTWAESQAGVTRVALRLYAPDPYWSIGQDAGLALSGSYTQSTAALNAAFIPGVGFLTGIANNVIRCAAVSGDDIYVGGDFTQVLGVSCNYVARIRNGVAYPLTSGVNGSVYTMDFGSDGKLYIGGAFTQAGGQTSNKLAAWDGSGWTAFPNACDGTIYALRNSKGYLYIGGAFTTINGQASQRLAAYHPSDGSWTYYSSGFNGTVLALGAGSGFIAIGGQFTAFGATTTRYAALLDTSTGQVSELGGGLNGQVNAIAVTGGEVPVIHAGGSFTQRADGTACYRLAYCTRYSNFQTYANWSGPVVLSMCPVGIGEQMLVGTSSSTSASAYLIEGSSTLTLPVTFYNSSIDVTCVFYRSGTMILGSTVFTSVLLPGQPTSATVYCVEGAKIIVSFSQAATLEAIGNVTTGTLAVLQYTGQAGEQLTIDLATGSVSSNLRNASSVGKFSATFPLSAIRPIIGENKLFVKISGSGATATLYRGGKYLTLAEALNG